MPLSVSSPRASLEPVLSGALGCRTARSLPRRGGVVVALVLAASLRLEAAEPPAAAPSIPVASLTERELLVDPPEARSRFGAWQLHLHVLVGVEPVDSARPVAFGAGTELLWRGRIGLFVALLSVKGNAVRATIENGQALAAPGDRISVPFGFAFRPLGHLGRRASDGLRGWAQRLAAGLGLELGLAVEHIRTSGESATVPALHAALATDIPLWGGPIEGGLALRLLGRLIAGPAVTLESGSVQMPRVSGQVYGGLAWTL